MTVRAPLVCIGGVFSELPATDALSSQGWTPVASNVTLAAGLRYAVDTSAARSLTLPAVSGLAGTLYPSIVVGDAFGMAATNTITITAAGSDTITISGTTYTYITITENSRRLELVAYPTTWRPIAF